MPWPRRFGAGDRGAQIALMTAYTESTLENLGPQTDNDGSLGLFQQRVAAGWGTAAEEQNPTDATAMFTQHLLAVAGLAEHRPLDGGAGRAGKCRGQRVELPGELEPGRIAPGCHHRIG